MQRWSVALIWACLEWVSWYLNTQRVFFSFSIIKVESRAMRQTPVPPRSCLKISELFKALIKEANFSLWCAHLELDYQITGWVNGPSIILANCPSKGCFWATNTNLNSGIEAGLQFPIFPIHCHWLRINSWGIAFSPIMPKWTIGTLVTSGKIILGNGLLLCLLTLRCPDSKHQTACHSPWTSPHH